MKKYFLLFVILFVYNQRINAQDFNNDFIINGMVIPIGSDVNDKSVDVSLFKNGNLVKQIKTKQDQKIWFSLKYQNEYILKMEKNGYISKSVIFRTHIDKNKISEGFEPYPFKIVLCKQDNDTIKEYPKPIALIKYMENNDVFDFDNLYFTNLQKEFKVKDCHKE